MDKGKGETVVMMAKYFWGEGGKQKDRWETKASRSMTAVGKIGSWGCVVKKTCL